MTQMDGANINYNPPALKNMASDPGQPIYKSSGNCGCPGINMKAGNCSPNFACAQPKRRKFC